MRDPDYVSSLSPYVDEQTKIAQAAADAQAQRLAQGSSVTNQVSNVEMPTAGLQTTTSNTPRLDAIRAAQEAEAAATAKLKADTEPKTPAPEGYFYQWHVFAGGGGEWRLIKATFGPTTPTNNGGGGGGGGGGAGTPTPITGTTTPPAPTGPTLAINTFKNTLALFFGAGEMTKPWVDELYKLVNPYYKSGSSIDEALNMAIQEGRNNPNLKEFTSRFKGIYDLQDKLLQGVAVTVPTIAEFVASEAKMGDVLNQAGLSSLNNQSYLGDIIGKGVNVTEFTNRINNVFLRIDQLPQQAKDFISGTFPTLDKTLLAKAILGGEKGALQLSKELSGMEVQAAGKAQGIGVDTATGLDIAARGFGYQEALTGFGTVAQSLPTYEKLQEISTGQDVKTAQAQAELQGMVFNKSIVDSMRAQQLAEQEIGRFSAKSGNIGSKAFASQARGAGLI